MVILADPFVVRIIDCKVRAALLKLIEEPYWDRQEEREEWEKSQLV